MVKERVDVLIAQRGLAPSREKAKILIMAGEILVDRQKVTRPDKKVEIDCPIEIRQNPIPYVSFGGKKLEKALQELDIKVAGKKVLDIGSSTGGFVDCLLQNKAALVYAIDAGTHQLHESLRGNPKIILKEKTNARYLGFDNISETVDIITIDVSFISLKKILPAVVQFLKPSGIILSLIKPQFEVGRYQVGKGGIVRDAKRIERVIEDIKTFGKDLGIQPAGMVEAPREKENKNREYFILWEKYAYREG